MFEWSLRQFIIANTLFFDECSILSNSPNRYGSARSNNYRQANPTWFNLKLSSHEDFETISFSVATTTTYAPVFNATAWCINGSKPVARYPYPGSTTCTQYVYCYLNNGLKGAVYTCVGTLLFNPTLGACDPNYTTCSWAMSG